MDAYIGEIRAFPYMFVPENWAACNGQLLAVQQYQVLYAVIGNIYGGNSTQFNLPNLQGSVLQGVAAGANKPITGGEETVTLNLDQIAPHNHNINALIHSVAQNSYTINTPSTIAYLTNGVSVNAKKGVLGFSAFTNNTEMNENTITVSPTTTLVGHENRMPYLALTYCICVTGGEFPPRP